MTLRLDTNPAPQRFALYTSSLGNYFFHEIRDLIGAGLKELGVTVEMRNERIGFAPKADWHLVIAPHEFFELGAGKDLVAKKWPSNLILFNTEQPSSYWLAISVKHFERAAAIWDIDFDSSLRICKRGYPCDYLPLGHVANSVLFQEVAQLPLIEETRRFPAEVRNHSGLQQSFDTRPIDLLFLGHGSPRRENYFTRHAARLNRLNCFFHKPAAIRPMIPGQTTNMNTLTSVGLSQRSKILLNLHHGVDKYFEWHRIVLLGIAQRTLVITEPCSIAPPFQANLDYVEAPLDELPERIEHYLGTPGGQAEAQSIIEHGFETLTARCRLSDRLRLLVEQLNAPAAARISTAERFFPVAGDQSKNQSALSICVLTPDVAGEGLHADCGSAQVAVAETLVRAGHRVTLLHTESWYGEGLSASHWRKEFSARGIDYLPLPANPQVPVEATEACNRSYETYLWLREKSFAAVHLPETHGIGFYSLLAKKQGLAFSQTRFCLHAHSPRAWRREASQQFINNAYELELDFLELECFRRADALVTSTRFLREWLELQNWALPDERQWLPNLIPPPLSQPPALTARIRELVYLGPLGNCPGLALFCQTLERLGPAALRNISITFADDSTTPKSPGALAYFYERTRQYTFAWKFAPTGAASLANYLQGEGRLIVLPSLLENSPLILRRCLAHGLPFLAVHSAGVAELIHPDDQAAALCSGTSTSLAAALQTGLDNGIRPARPVELSAMVQSWLQWHKSWITRKKPAMSTLNGCLPLVSVCLVHFNRPEFLAQALASLRAQDYSNFEVVLVDDGSTRPEAIAFLASLEPEFKQRNWQIIRQENRYLGAARNNGARHAHGEYVVFMDDDNFAKPHELSTFVRVAQTTGAEILTSAMDLFTGTAAPRPDSKPTARWIFLGGAAATGVFRNCFGDANGCIRRETFLRLGGFTEDRGITHEDWEFYARATLQGCHLETVPEALFHYRVADQSMIRSTPRFANHQRSLRPYLAAVPAPLRGLVHCLQGALLFPADKIIPNPGHENLLRLHRRMVAIAKDIFLAGQRAAAEAMFLELLQSAEATQHPGVVLQSLLAIGNTLVDIDLNPLAETLIERAVKIARAGCDPVMIKEAEESLAAARNRRHIAKMAPVKQLIPATQVKVEARPLVQVNPPEVVPTPLVTIIIPVFNKLALTKGCLESLARTRNASTWEIIVVDNASTDGTAEFLSAEQTAGRIQVIISPKNGGFARACNQGAQAARGSLLVFLNNDTQVTNGWIDAMVATSQNLGVGVVGAKLLYANNTIQHAGIGWINGVPDHPHRHAHPLAKEVNTPRELDMVTGACLLIHRDLFFQLAGFDEIYRNGVEDVDLCLRVRAAGRKVMYEPKAEVYHLEGQSAGRFTHVAENLKIFFTRWSKWFDARKCFIAPAKPEFIAASQSFLASPANATATGAKPVIVSWEGSFLDHGSLSHVNRELTGALRDLPGVQIKCVTNGSAAAADAADAWPQFIGTMAALPTPTPAITVRHAWPPNWRRPASGKLVVIQPWEFGALPEAWVRQACDVDEFWIPSEYVRQVYVDSGVPAEKVFVVPNGVDVETFQPGAAPMKLATQKKFRFLFVGGTIGRKGPDLLLQAYVKNFAVTDDVCLVIKDFGGQSVYAGQTFEAQIRAAQARPDAPEILYLNEELPPGLLPGLYTACDCLVLPYRGEGFGLPAIEAMACGLPLIVTAGGATDDFVRDEFAWRIPAERKIFGQEVSGLKLVNPGWLLEPNLPAIGEMMRRAFSDPAAARERGKLARLHAQQHWSWKNAAARAGQRIRALSEIQKVPPEKTKFNPGPIKPPLVSEAGRLDEARELFKQKNLPAAWAAAITAVAHRSFHPEAFLLLAEIARAAGDGTSAKLCAKTAREFAPGWNPARQFLQKPLKGDAKHEWLKLPPVCSSQRSTQNLKLSLCLIVKNEEAFLGRCLKSVRELATQIIVVDTGSTDRTVEIAQEFGAEIYSFAWGDDFAAARNAALEHATGDWVLMLDADEELPAAQHNRLRADMKQSDVMAYRLPLVNCGQEAEGRSFVPRLFRNAPGNFYFGRIHEQVFSSLLPQCKAWGLKTAFGTAEILHHGYTKEMVRDRNKIERNLKLLPQAIAENPADVNLVMNLGLELVRSGDLAGGVTKYRDAFDLISAQSPAEIVAELREVLLTQFTSQLYKIRAHEEVVRVLDSPLAKNGGLTASLHFALGLAYFELKDYCSTAGQMRQCVAKRKEPGLSPINTGILTSAPNHCLALSLAKLDDVIGAEEAFQAALGEPGRQEDVKDVKLDHAKFVLKQNREVDALNELHEMVAANPNHLAAWQLGGIIALSQPDFLEFARDWTGEAMKNHAEDLTVNAQRAEALLLMGDTAAAGELWERVWNREQQPNFLAALILCEAVETPTTHAPEEGPEELATSRAFIAWYQKLIAVRAQKTILKINGSTDKISRALPTAAKILATALTESKTCATV